MIKERLHRAALVVAVIFLSAACSGEGQSPGVADAITFFGYGSAMLQQGILNGLSALGPAESPRSEAGMDATRITAAAARHFAVYTDYLATLDAAKKTPATGDAPRKRFPAGDRMTPPGYFACPGTGSGM